MTKKKVTIDVVFNEEVDDYEGYVSHKIDSMNISGVNELTTREIGRWAEMFCQSDFAYIDFPTLFSICLEAGKVDFPDRQV